MVKILYWQYKERKTQETHSLKVMPRVIYYLEFSDTHTVPVGSPLRTNFPNGRRHKLEIIDNDASGTDVTTPNVVGDRSPVQLIWDNSDDIYNPIMSARMEMNFLTDPVKMIDVEQIISNDDPGRFQATLSIANSSGGFDLYWDGFITNVQFEQQINSYPVPYQLIATDLLPSLKNVDTSDGTAIYSPKQTVIGYLENLLAFLPYGVFYNIRIYNNYQLDNPIGGLLSVYMQDLPGQYFLEDGFNYQFDTAYEFLENVLRQMNARLFVAEQKFYIIPNAYGSSTMDALVGSVGTDWDAYENSLLQSGTTFQVNFKEYSTPTSSFNVTKNIKLIVPTDLQEVGSSLKIRYEQPIDKVIVSQQFNKYVSNYDAASMATGANFTSYPSIEKTNTGILYNQTYFSDDYSVIGVSQVLQGNFSFKTDNVTSSTVTNFSLTERIFDTGFSANAVTISSSAEPWLTFSVFPQNNASSAETISITFEWGLAREIGATKSYYHNGSWTTFTSDTDIKITGTAATLNMNEWNTLKDDDFQIDNGFLVDTAVKYRLIIQRAKTSAVGVIYHFDNCYLNETVNVDQGTSLKLQVENDVSLRRGKEITLDLKNTFGKVPVILADFFTPRISGTTFNLGELIAQEILNDNREHLRRYSITVKAKDGFQQFIYPWHKIWIDYTGHDSYVLGIIDRMRYSAREGLWQIEFHIPVQRQSVATNVRLIDSNIFS
jgi:hypothetical protein